MSMDRDPREDEALARLAAHDTAAGEPTDEQVVALRERILVQARAEGEGVVTPLRRTARAPRILAAAAALVVVAGAAGAVGRATAPADLASLSLIPSANGAAVAEGASRDMSADSAKLSYGGWWGTTLLEPGAGLSDVAGSAAAFTYDNSSVNPQSLASALAAAMDASGTVSGNATEGWSITGPSNDGGQFNGWVGVDPMGSFSGYVDVRSPWFCASPEVRGTDAVAPGSNDGAVSEPMPACTPTPMTAPDQQDAIDQVRRAFSSLGLNVDGVRFTAATYESTVSVTGWMVVNDQVLPTSWNAEVSERGIVSLAGFTATLTALPDYPVVGARTAALRTQDPRWSGLGPTSVWLPESGEVTPMARDMAVTPESPAQVRIVDGRPVITTSVSVVTVTDAVMGLGQYWLADGRPVLLPSWQYTAADGSRWAMLAITDDYVDIHTQ